MPRRQTHTPEKTHEKIIDRISRLSGLQRVWAQVNLYGIADAGVPTSPGSRVVANQLSSGIMEGSRWGLRVKDMGGGFKSHGTMESRFEGQRPLAVGLPARQPVARSSDRWPAALGSSGGSGAVARGVVNLDSRLFDRQAWVGLVTLSAGF